MGENILQNQVKNFKKGVDRSIKLLSTPTLFDHEDVVRTTYTAAPLNGSEVEPGAVLLGHIGVDGQSVNLAKGHQIVATIKGDGARSLVDAMQERGSAGIASMRVIDRSTISGFLKVIIQEREGSNE